MNGRIWAPVLTYLLVVAVAGLAEDSSWKAAVALGASVSSGNSETMTLSPELSAELKTGANEADFGTAYSYAENDGDISERNAKAAAQYNRLFSARLYAYAKAEAGFDHMANNNYRLIGGPGMGYYLIKSEKVNCSVELGATVITEENEVLTAPAVTDEETKDSIAARIAQKFDAAVGESAKVWETIEYLPDLGDPDIFLLTSEVGVEAMISKSLSLRASVHNRYDGDPTHNIEKSDTTLKAALVCSLGK